MADSLRQSLNAANPQTMADLLRALGLGDLVRQSMVQQMRGAAPAASSSQLATVQQLGLDITGAPTSANGSPTVNAPSQGAGCRAVSILQAYSRAGANAGQLTVVANSTTPATGQVAVAPNGDIVVLAADGHTVIDVDFMAMRGDYVQLTGLTVASNKALLPAWTQTQGVLLLISATATAGTNTGSFVVLKAASAPSNKQAALDVTKSNLVFAAGDAVTQASCELLLCSSKNIDSLLRSASTILP